MPVQQQMSSFAERLGGRVSQANQETANKPINTGSRQLPPGIKMGLAKISALYTKKQTEDKKKIPLGETFFRVSATVLGRIVNGQLDETHGGNKISGLVTQGIIPLCDTPEGYRRFLGIGKNKTFVENWDDFRSVFGMLGVAPCQETLATDPTGARTEAYFMAAMKTLNESAKSGNPLYILFETRAYTPPRSPTNPNPQEMVFETWTGRAQWNGQVDPTAAVTTTQPEPMTVPPGQSQLPQIPSSPQEPEDRAELIAALVEIAMSDPQGATENGASASTQLEELAWAVGWTQKQTAAAIDWAAVGDLALNPPPANSTPEATPTTAPVVTPVGVPVVGMKYKFAKRTTTGEKLKDSNGKEFPPQSVTVIAVDAAARTCILRSDRDGKEVVDIRTKKPTQVKFEWLE